MKNLLALLGLVLVLFFGVGYFRGWYSFNFSTGTDGKTNISIGVDRTKVGGDLEQGREWAGEKIDQLKTPQKTDGQVQPAGGTQPAAGTPPVANLPAPSSGR